jgi:MoxR-like ATPase
MSEDLRELRDAVTAQIGGVVVAQEDVVDLLLTAVVLGGHVLLEGVPGVAKSLLAGAFARTIDGDFRRAQFTPDMLPSDLTGTMTLRGGELAFRPGPVFTNVLLADEINRTPPKTQSALLEAMQEGQVSIEGESHPLPDPFLVIATQNPVEYEGTYPLPEAQLDRFLLRALIEYPSEEQERAVLTLPRSGVSSPSLDSIAPVLDADSLHAARRTVNETAVADEVVAYVIAIVRVTRRLPSVSLGASPRAAVHLLAAAKARARIQGRAFVTPDDVAAMAPAALAALALAVATVADAWSVRTRPKVTRTVAPLLSRGVSTPVVMCARVTGARRVTVRQALPPALAMTATGGDDHVEGGLVARVRGRHVRPELGTRAEGRLGLGAWYRRGGGEIETRVYPDLVSAQRLARAAREGLLLDSSHRARGPVGLGTDFESVREWLPDDDVRYVNWPATQRLGRPMTNQYTLERARELIFLVDTGRLMGAPLGDRTRLDAALDAVAAVALAADQLGDHTGAVAFDGELRAQLRPRRSGGRDVLQALFDLQPRSRDSDYELAFRAVAAGKRALVLIFSDLFDEAAARAMIDAVPVLARRHSVLVASVTDPDLHDLTQSTPQTEADVYAAAAALELLASRTEAAARLRRAGARVLEAPPDALAAACVRGYLQAKARLRL